MHSHHRRLLVALLLVLPIAAATLWPAHAQRNDALTIATWNLEWLVAPETAHAGRLACRRGQRSPLPCDVVEDLARDSADLARLASYVRELDADIIAFQEVENAAIARKVFRGYRICMADGKGAQHVGFAVRAHLAHRCGPAVEALSLRGRSRKGMSLLLTPARGTPIELLAVHLKSGCSRDPIDSDLAACRMLRQQAVTLGEWIAHRNARATPFIVLGDFNRVTPATADDAFWQLVHVGPSDLVASRLPFQNCHVGQPFSQFIDHVVISRNLLPDLIPGSPRHRGFRSADVARYRLSDHCPVSISVRIPNMT